ncbi:dihydroxyacetone kinase subunit DhaK [Enterococcus dongliensis]|uniref:dihydroxyacetone kinase subunit DhaK n=1 Tax=Enterococcus dongliensis TaxID=2559925 RepID=UPI00288EA6B8|nr:dihydroxyacetone kinase subunit DhaK [Enterococcus dongliensis]MDT2702972.1 dihydroxyacetone kinase subunit DhaK [Enterococcus dongliensis]
MPDVKKLMNDPNTIVKESIEGMLLAYPNYYQKHSDKTVLFRSPDQQKVSLVSGGGSGHEPMVAGLIGDRMLSGAALGNVFASPDPQTILAAMESVKSDAGILILVWNYAGDRMNFDTAAEFAEMKGLKVDTVIINDDIASAPKERAEERRGVAGILLIAKIAGAAADRGDDLASVKALAQAATDNTKTIGIALSACSIPGKPRNFMIAEDEFEYGMGIHGEPGIKSEVFKDAKSIVQDMMDDLIEEFGLEKLQSEEVVVLVNGMAATTSLELFLINQEVREYLANKKITVYDNVVGKYCTSLEMAGASISLMTLDDERKTLYDVPAATPFYSRYIGGVGK